MNLLPAIDLRDGKCVRLLQGDYARQIDYREDPVGQARAFEDEGARWVHVVDLDGARRGSMANRAVIERITSETKLQVEVGGGIRDETVVHELLQAGVRQVVIGTRALEDLAWFERLVHDDRCAGRVVLGLDARKGRLSTHGWTTTEEMTALEMAEKVTDWPLAGIVYTDIERDGMLTGPNLLATEELARRCKVGVIASGGVSRIEDIERLASLPLHGIIVGRALYEGRFRVSQALAAIQKNPEDSLSDNQEPHTQ